MKSPFLKRMTTLMLICVFTSFAFLPKIILGQERNAGASTPPPAKKSTSAHQIPWSNINSGGTLTTGHTTFRMSASHGQTVIGKSETPNKQLLSGFWNPSDIQTAVPPDPQSLLPVDFELKQNYPNPFNPSTTICYSLPYQSHVTLVICNLQGEQVRKLVDEVQPAGAKKISWDGRDERNNRAGSGLYLYRIIVAPVQGANGAESRVFSQSNKMLLLK